VNVKVPRPGFAASRLRLAAGVVSVLMELAVVVVSSRTCDRRPVAVNRPMRVMPATPGTASDDKDQSWSNAADVGGTVLFCATASPESIPPLVLMTGRG